MLLLLGAVGYAVLSAVQGNTTRLGILTVCLVGYYFLVLHKPVRSEIRRRRELKQRGEDRSKP